MKIVIPKEYRGKFVGGKAYISYWPRPWRSVLITNKKMLDELQRRINLLIAGGYWRAQFLRFMTAGAVGVKLDKNGAVECPKWLVGWLGKGKLNYEKGDWGIVVSGKKGADETDKPSDKRVGSENQEKRNQLKKQLSTQVGRCFICGGDNKVKRRDVRFRCLHMEAKSERKQTG